MSLGFTRGGRGQIFFSSHLRGSRGGEVDEQERGSEPGVCLYAHFRLTQCIIVFALAIHGSARPGAKWHLAEVCGGSVSFTFWFTMDFLPWKFGTRQNHRAYYASRWVRYLARNLDWRFKSDDKSAVANFTKKKKARNGKFSVIKASALISDVYTHAHTMENVTLSIHTINRWNLFFSLLVHEHVLATSISTKRVVYFPHSSTQYIRKKALLQSYV